MKTTTTGQTWLGIALLLLGAGGGATATAAPPVLVADFAPGTAPAPLAPENLATIGDRLYFTGLDLAHGWEPWVSDGTSAGTRLLADLCPGPCSSWPSSFRRLGDRLVVAAPSARGVFAIDADGRSELLFHDARSVFSFPLIQLGERAYFRPIDSPAGGSPGFVVTDGTAAGTHPTEEFACATPPCALDLAAVGGALYYSADGQLFRKTADGTVTRLAGVGAVGPWVALDAVRYVFRGCNAAGCQPWVTDGTAAGTRRLAGHPGEVAAGRNKMIAWRGRAYFVRDDGQVASTGGTFADTRLEPAFPVGQPELLAADPAHLFFSAADGDGRSLFALGDGGVSLPLRHSAIADFYPVGLIGGDLLVLHFDDESRRSLAATGGDPASTRELEKVDHAGPGALLDGALYLPFDRIGDTQSMGLWRTDGRAIAPVEPAATPRSSFTQPFRTGDALVARSWMPDAGAGVYRLDPGSVEVTEIGDPYFEFEPAAAGSDHVYFKTSEFFSSSLSVAGPAGGLELLDLGPIGEAGLAGDDHLFFGKDGQLWESDGTAAGTRALLVVPRCEKHCEESLPRQITPSGDRVYFVAAGATPDSSRALWVWRRGAARADFLMPVGVNTRLIAVPPNRIAFVVRDEATAISQLWAGAGGGRLRNLLTLPPGYEFGLMAAAGQRLFFTVAHDGGSLPWATNTALSGAEQLLSFGETAIDELVASGDRVFWSGTRVRNREPELGFSGGTLATTGWLDLKGGWRGANARNLAPTGDGRIVFAADVGDTGLEPWISDGTLAGSRLLADVAPGFRSSAPSDFALVNGRLFFAAEGDENGRELWALDLELDRRGAGKE